METQEPELYSLHTEASSRDNPLDCDNFKFEFGIIMVTVFILGIFGNTMSFITTCFYKEENVVAFLVKVMAIFDTILLVSLVSFNITTLVYFVSPKAGVYLWNNVQGYITPITLPLVTLGSTVSVWTMVIIGIHRYIELFRPFDATRLSSRNRVSAEVGVVILLSIFYCNGVFPL